MRRSFALGLSLWLIAGVIGTIIARPVPPLTAAALDEYQVKAAYLYNFAKFVEWPADAFASPTAPMVIGVYGIDPFGPTLDNLLRDKKVAGRSFQVRRSTRIQELRNSHILFVGEGQDAPSALIRTLAGASVLTVGQSPDFLRDGGIVLFQIEDGRVVFSIDSAAAAKAHLSISSQLLRLSRLNGGARS